MQRPPTAALIIALIPFLGMCFTVSLWDRATPLILGLPFNMVWLLAWIVLTTLCLALAHRIMKRTEGGNQ